MKGFRVGGHGAFSTLDRRLANLDIIPEIDESGKMSAPGTGSRRQADLRDLAMRMAAEPEDSGFWYGLGQGTGSAAIELPQLLAGGVILKGATLPVMGALSARTPGEAVKNAIEGYFFHKGMQFTAPLGRVRNALVWTGVPTAQGLAEGKSPGEALGGGLSLGAMSLGGGRRAEVIEDGVRRPAKVADLVKIRAGELQLAPPVEAVSPGNPPDRSKFPFQDMYTVDDKTGRVYQNGQPTKYVKSPNGLLKETPLPGTAIVPTKLSPLGVRQTRFIAGEQGIIDPMVPVWRMGGEGDTRQLLPSEVQSLDPKNLKYNEQKKRYEYDPHISVNELFDKPEKGSPSLSQFARKYGVKADDVNSGEARRLSNKETGTTGIVRRNGISAEQLAEKSWEEGYYSERPDPNQLLSDIEDDLSGRRKIYAQTPELDYETEFRKAYPDEARVADGIKALESDPVGGKLYDLIAEGKDPYGRNERLFRSVAGSKGLSPEDIDTIVQGARRSLQTGEAESNVPVSAGSETGESAGSEGSTLGDLFDAPQKDTRPPVFVKTPQEVNGKVWYHGTGSADLSPERLDPTVTKAEGLFGQGIYLTDNRDIAQGYAKNRGKRTGTPTVYQAKVNIGRVLNLEESAPPDVVEAYQRRAKAITDWLGDDSYFDDFEKVARKPNVTGEELHRALSNAVSEASQAEQIPSGDFYEDFGLLSDDLRRLGYDALTHVGGNRTGKPPHQVLILLDPNDYYSQTGRKGQVASFDEAQAEIDAIIKESNNQFEGDTSFNPQDFEGRITPELRGVVRGALQLGRDVYQTGMSLVDFTKRMVARLGEKVKPYLDSIYAKVKAFHEDERGFINFGSKPKTEKDNYSGMGVFEDTFSGNLGQVRRADPNSALALRRGAGASAQARNIMANAFPRIDRTLAGSGISLELFRKSLMESRLQGVQERWATMSTDIQKMPDADLQSAYDSWLKPLLERIDAKNIPSVKQKMQTVDSLGRYVGDLIDNGEFGEAKQVISETFDAASRSVASIDLEGRTLADLQADPGYQKALLTYKALVEKPLSDSHGTNEGVFSNALGPLDTYYPLIPLDAKARSFDPAQRLLMRKPKNISNQFATGFGEYDPSSQAFAQRLRRSITSNNRASAIDTLEKAGLVRTLKANEPGQDALKFQGVDYPASEVVIDPVRQIYKDGKVINVPPKRMLVPDWLKEEFERVFPQGGNASPGAIEKAISSLNRIALVGPLDLVFHNTNLISALVTGTPFITKKGRGTGLGAWIGNLPITKAVNGIAQAIRTDPATPESIRRIQELAELGLIPDKYGSETYSRKLAEEMGAESATLNNIRIPFTDKQPLKEVPGLNKVPWGSGPILYGPKGFDIRVRLVLDRIFTDLFPGASKEDRVQWNKQLPNYVRGLQGKIETTVKDSGLAPFYTAGSTVYRTGMRGLLAATPLPKGLGARDVPFRLAQQLTGGVIGLAAAWALGNRATTGQWPWDDKRSRLFQIRLPDSIRHTPVIEEIYGKDGDAYVDLANANPAVVRALKAFGIPKAYDVAQAGGSAGQAVEHGLVQATNTAMHPLTSSPLVRIPFNLAGVEPYITGPRDDRGNFRPLSNLLPTIEKTEIGWPTVGRIAGTTLLGTNSFFENIAESTGMAPKVKEDDSNQLVKMAINLVAPRLVGTPYDRDRMVVKLAKERGLSEENVQKETRKDLIEKARQGENVKSETKADVKSGVLAGRDRKTILHEGRQTDLQAAFDTLGAKESLDAYESLTPDKQQEVRIQLLRKRKSLKNLPPAEKKALIQRFNQVLGQ
jgi:hypothetical protein